MKTIDDFNIGKVGAFMFKHYRASSNITLYKEEFRCLRHGHYDELIERIQSYFPGKKMESPVLAAYNPKTGEVTNDKTQFNQKIMCDFIGLVNCQEPMYHFSKLLLKEYGLITDPEFNTKTFQEVVLFELGLRNALCNEYENRDWERDLITTFRMELEDVIDELCFIRNTTKEEWELLHKGRHFRNYITYKKLKKSQFSSREDALDKFNKAVQVARTVEAVLYD